MVTTDMIPKYLTRVESVTFVDVIWLRRSTVFSSVKESVPAGKRVAFWILLREYNEIEF